MMLVQMPTFALFLLAASAVVRGETTATTAKNLRSVGSGGKHRRQLQAVTKLRLINAATNQPVQAYDPLVDGAVIDLSQLPDNVQLNIEAVTDGNTGPVTFDYNGSPNFRTEGVAPYAFCGDSGGSYFVCTQLTTGEFTIKATPNSGTALEVSFSIQDGNGGPTPPGPEPTEPPTMAPTKAPTKGATPSPTKSPTKASTPSSGSDISAMKLINAQTDSALMDLVDGSVVDLAALGVPPGQFSIQAIAGSANVNKVSFVGDGINPRTEGAAPYAACGDGGGDYWACTNLLPPNTYTITATPEDASGSALTPRSVTFTIVNGGGGPTPPAPSPAPTPSPTKAPTKGATPSPTPGPTPAPVPTGPTPTGFPLDGTWVEYTNQNINGRHEACFVMVGRKAYLMGGRESRKVDIFDAVSRTWSQGGEAPKTLHHMQCIAVNGKIYLPAAWTGGYPREDNVDDHMYVYNTVNDKWETEPAMPEYRRRGSAAVVVDGTKIWVSHGNRGGHETKEEDDNPHAESFGWIDYYNTVSKQWVMGDVVGYPNAPNPRDHTGGALVNGRICVAAGRNGGLKGWPNVGPTDCFDPQSKTWTEEAPIPELRGGSAYGTTCDGRLIVAGGERDISSRVDIFDGTNWERASDFNDSRHGTGLGVDCVCNLIYMASGAGNNGGGQLKSIEIYYPDGQEIACNA